MNGTSLRFTRDATGWFVIIYSIASVKYQWFAKLPRCIGRHSCRMWFLFHIWNTWHSCAVRVKWKRSSQLNVFFRVNCIKHKRFKVAKTTHVHMWQTTQTHIAQKKKKKKQTQNNAHEGRRNGVDDNIYGRAKRLANLFETASDDYAYFLRRRHLHTHTYFQATVRPDIVIKMPSTDRALLTNETHCVYSVADAGLQVSFNSFFFGLCFFFVFAQTKWKAPREPKNNVFNCRKSNQTIFAYGYLHHLADGMVFVCHVSTNGEWRRWYVIHHSHSRLIVAVSLFFFHSRPIIVPTSALTDFKPFVFAFHFHCWARWHKYTGLTMMAIKFWHFFCDSIHRIVYNFYASPR